MINLRTERILKRFLKTPGAEKIVHQIEAEEETARQALIADYQRIAGDRRAFVAAQEKELATRRTQRHEAERTLQECWRGEREIADSIRGREHSAALELEGIAKQLRATAPACIQKFIDECNRAVVRSRQSLKYENRPTGRYFPVSNVTEAEVFTNERAIDRFIQHVNEDITWAMQVAPVECLNEADALTEIEKRKGAWPKIELEKAS